MRLTVPELPGKSRMNLLNQEISAIAQEAPLVERQFAARSYCGKSIGPEVIEIIGNVPILLSSPHATNHPREGRVKLADTFTGTLAIQLAKLTGASALIYARTTDEDPAYDADGYYKQRLTSLLAKMQARFVLDIHGMKQSRPVDFEFGTAHGVTLGDQTMLLTTFVDVFKKAGFDNFIINTFFSASRPTTIASFTWRTCKVPSIQLEIHKRYRDPENNPEAYAALLALLRDTLHTIQQLF
jgi:hypothetical protein